MIAAVVSIIFAACKKRETTPTPVDSDTSGAADNALAEGTFNDISNIADQGAAGSLSSYLSASNNYSGERGTLTACAIITLDSTVSGGITTHTIKIDFGAIPHACLDGKIRTGIINASYKGYYHALESRLVIGFDQYSVNGNLVVGSNTIIHKNPVNGHKSDSIYVNATITKFNSGGATIHWVSSRAREWIAGDNTPSDKTDDIFSISGNITGTHSNGNGFSATCDNLKIHLNCKWIESGDLNYTPSGKSTRYIKFGTDGTCDSLATVQLEGVTTTFIMP